MPRRAISLTWPPPEEERPLLFGERLSALSGWAIDEAIEKRRQALARCVGTLYPAILLDEIGRLEERRRALAGGVVL